jgi:hypothetical protein
MPLSAALTRRRFLAGAGGSALAIDAALAQGLACYPMDLRIDLSEDAKTLAVREIPVGKAVSDPVLSTVQWCVHATAFGPNASFELSVKAKPPESRRLRVRNASFGGSSRVNLDFLFRPHINLTAKAPILDPANKAFVDFWLITLRTDLWRDPKNANAPWKSSELRFGDFVLRTRSLQAPSNAAHVKARLSEMFDGRVTSPEKIGGPPNLTFLPDCVWRLSRDGAPAATSFDGRVSAGKFSLGWYGVREGVAFFGGFATSKDHVRLDQPAFHLGEAGHTRVEITNIAAPSTSVQWEARRVVSPLLPSAFQSLSKLTFGEAKLTVISEGKKTVERVRAASLFLTETLLPGGKTMRQALWGAAGPGDKSKDENQDQENSRHPPAYELRTLIGRLQVDAPPVTAKPPAAQKDQSPKELAASAPVCAPCLQPALRADPSRNRTGEPAAAKDQVCFTDGPKDSSEQSEPKQNSEILTAIGDRTGVRDASIWAVFDRAGELAPFIARRIAVDLTLRGSNLALTDASHSSLWFDSADLRLLYEDGRAIEELKAGEFPRSRASSFVWIGPIGKDVRKATAQFDLSRATLTVARDVDLVKLRFRFLDMNLVLCPTPVIRPAHEDCRVIESNGVLRDDRPILVAEFDPQHVFEEAIFKQIVPPPDVALDPEKNDGDDAYADYQRVAILNKIACYDVSTAKGQQDLIDYRQKVQELKKRADKVDKSLTDACKAFSDFSAAYLEAATAAGLPKWQRIYVGPFALDPDAMALARRLVQEKGAQAISNSVDGAFKRIAKFIADNSSASPPILAPVLPNGQKTETDAVYLQNALNNETIFEQQEPLYGVFRDFYRDLRVGALQAKGVKPAQSQDQVLIEYLADSNRPVLKIDDPNRADNDKNARLAFVDKIADAKPVDGLVEARLSGRTRLAFHVNCQPAPGATPEEAKLHPSSGASPEAPGSGGFSYPQMPFTFDALTDWSRHEPAVTLRAQKLFTANANGILPPIGERAPNLTDSDILAFQGLTRGQTTAEQRLGEIRASLARKPTEFETAIEIPARLTLSTAQDAIWLADRKLPAEVLNAASCDKSTPTKPVAKPAVGEAVLKPGMPPEHSRKALWTARLSLDGAQPDLRIVDSPDLRPQALTLLPYKDRLPGQGAPPRGPLAPWFIGQEQMDAKTLTADSVNKSLPKPLPDGHCKPPVKDGIWRILKMLCGRDEARGGLSDWRVFRAALDAYDRHELVLLSSAYGLPVIGKRKAVPGTGAAGELVSDSGQIEPGDGFPILEVDDGQAIQRPQPLHVTELWLSALGGSLLHDTRFYPSAGATDLWGKQVFDGFSIERWRAEIVLGRDIVGEVVYKGYLFPFGHRASLVKLTERLFLLTQDQGVKAILVQRIFLRVGRKSQAYPVVGQPFDGRLWCSQDVTIRTVQTPDLRDPYEQPKSGQTESPEGRIGLGDAPGLAFWPRINETAEGLVKFDIAIDGATTSIPLIFVDNIAATNAMALRNLAKLYRETGKWLVRRTVVMGLQNIRFAPEWTPGDCSLKTETILLDVHGRLASLNPDWAGDLNEYRTTPILEGAEQPPFYPAMNYATVRLEQVERFSGGKPSPVDVQYDGHYVRKGFSDRSAEKPANPMEIFLDLRTTISMTMGNNGDRSGAVGRPDSDIVALGRRNGPMGASGTIVYETSAADPPTTRPVTLPPKASTGERLIDPAPQVTDFEKLQSLADFFNAASTGASPPDSPGAEPSRQLVVGTAPPQKTDELKNTLKLLQSFFSGSAKVLGVVSIRDLLSFLGLDDLIGSTPVLRQTLQFGAGALDEAQSLVQDVHARILAPLKAAVDRLNAQWTALDQSLKQKIGDHALGLIEVFPEVSAGLKDLSAKLAVAQAENDAIQLTSDLGDIYESGRAFVAALNRIAANPLARLKTAAIADIQQVLTQFAQALTVFDKPLAAIKGQLDAVLQAPSTILDWVDDQLSGHENEFVETLTLTLAGPDLVALVRQTGLAIDDDLRKINEDFKTNIKISANKFVDAVIAGLFDGSGNLDKTWNTFFQSVQNQAELAINQANVAVRSKLQATRPEVVYIVNAELQAFADSVTPKNALKSPVLQNVIRAGKIISDILGAVRQLKAHVEARQIHESLVDLDTISGLVFGIGAGPFAQIDTALSKGFKGLQGEATNLVQLVAIPDAKVPIFAKELDACSKYKNALENDDTFGTHTAKLIVVEPSSGEPMATLVAALKTLDGIIDNVGKLDKLVNDPGNQSKIKAVVGQDGLNKIVALSKATSRFLSGDTSSNYGLRGDLSTVYSESVKALARLRAVLSFIAKDGAWDNVDQKFADTFGQYIRALADSMEGLGASLVSMVGRIDKFVAEHKDILITASLLGGAGEAVANIPGLSSSFKDLKEALDKAEPDVVKGLVGAVNFAVSVLTGTSSFAGGLADRLTANLATIRSDLGSFGVNLDPEYRAMVDDVAAISATFQTLSSYHPISNADIPAKIAEFLDKEISPKGPVLVKSLVGDANGKYVVLSRELSKVAADAMAQWRALQARAKGLPWTLDGAAFSKLQPLLSNVATGYVALKKSRDDVIDKVASPLFSLETQRALLAPPTFYPPLSNILDPNIPVGVLKDKDRLFEEVGVLNAAAKYKFPDKEPAGPDFDNLLRFVSSWTGKNTDKSAPLQIADRVRDLAAQVLKGEILSLIDVAAFRDAIQDAIAQLVPTRAVFSYDFSKVVTEPPSDSSIFQAQLGAAFVLSMRLTVDLLAAQKSDFQVTGSLGAFDIKLVGDFIDALTLHFGGAKFESRGDAKPRFDVSYVGYEIGEALEFAKEIQDYLTPSDGAGVHIGPLDRTLGLEAGYGINLGSIGVGEVSFFNIILDVSAELPFTDSEALFKTSLGTRLTPFTMSILPFAGSGYFAIYSAADGIRGFEASFMFGAGGSLQFGPLAAEVQIQVGTFIRVLKVDGVNSTEIYGTFLAAGAASIWIFHFAATLYVCLGADSSGNMYGEATFSFSFSCGFIHYNYSVTVSHNEPPIGGGSGSKQGALEDAPQRVQFAALNDPSVLSDVPLIAFAQADYGPAPPTGAKPKPVKRMPPATPVKHLETHSDQSADVVSRAICQSDDWKTFSSYFNAELLPAEL